MKTIRDACVVQKNGLETYGDHIEQLDQATADNDIQNRPAFNTGTLLIPQ